MRRHWIAAAMIIVQLPAIALAQIGFGRIAKNGPFAEFRDGDWEMFRQTLRRSAEVSPEGEVVKWSNAATGAGGDVTVVKRYDLPDLGTCRDLNSRTIAKGRTGPFSVTLCRLPGGEWRIKAN
jgi:surface antigen